MSEQKTAKNKSKRVKKEEEILKFWKDKNIFQKSLEKDSPEGEFIFYEGPPTANGKPGIHHLEARAFKDAIPRYKTMRGFHVRRKGGWDTHGLPVEIEVEKELGFKSKKDIEEYGIAKFNSKCKESVWKYVDEWKKFTERIGYWEDLDNPYVTYYPDYMETLWWIIGEVEKRGLLYKDYKVLPWCPRCETALATHELAQGYKTVKDLSLTVKFEILNPKSETNSKSQSPSHKTYILAWTTTPWTLPGNVALAVGRDILYIKIKQEDEFYILAKDRLNIVEGDYEIVDEFYGKDLLGKRYKPLFPFLKEMLSKVSDKNLDKAYLIYEADFVTTEEGTGVVHTAVMYGQDDFALGTRIGLPKHHLINAEGNFLPGTGFLEGKFVKDEETEVSILKDLASRNLLFSKGKYEHSYPFCWRCDTPLIYFARDSWYIKMSALQSDLIRANEEINWEPEYLKYGRFGEWLEGVRDWAISRERYWGTPLPVWISTDGKDQVVIDSFDTLKKYTKKSGNKYLVIRHGESENNAKEIISDKVNNPHHLTEKGKEQVKKSAKKLKSENIDLIISSPFVRTKETADIIAKEIGLYMKSITYDKRIQEIQTGGYNLMPINKYHGIFLGEENHFNIKKEGGETLFDVKKRMGDFIYDIESKYKNKNILIVTHASPGWMLFSAAYGSTKEELESKDYIMNLHSYLKNAEVKKMDFIPLPHNKFYERDLHRPYVDKVVLYKGGKEFKRVLEVMDVWFDSGAMPFAQDHYPFENEKWIEKGGYPADYISEAIDQTRGWFYTLHAVGVLLGRGKAFKNVVSLGHILDAEGKKMSKSKGNTVNPFEMINKYGADALRMWMYMTNQPGESKNFDEKTVDEVSKKVLNPLENVLKFYELYADERGEGREESGVESKNVLDVWITTKIFKLSEDIAKYLDNYKFFEPTREIREFIADLSQWYIRRSRNRFKEAAQIHPASNAGGASADEPSEEDSQIIADKENAVATTRFVLLTLSKLIAPFMPFVAEDIYGRVGGEKESVHLEAWLQDESGKWKVESGVLEDMREVREVVSLALEARDKAGIKVRQPLSQSKVKSQKSKVEGNEGLVQLIKDEVNVKDVVFEKGDELSVELDTNITEKLKKEGQIRELLRSLQNLRKEKGFKSEEIIDVLTIETDDKGQSLIRDFEGEVKKQVRVKNILFEKASGGIEIVVDKMKFEALLS